MKIDRRLRGLLGTSLAWAAAFGGLSVALILVIALLGLRTGAPAPWHMFRSSVPLWSAFGFCSGAAFSGLLIALERGRTLDTLSTQRFSAWGIVAGVLVPLYPCLHLLSRGGLPGGWLAVAVSCGFGGTMGFAIAHMSLRAARRAQGEMLTRGSAIDLT